MSHGQSRLYLEVIGEEEQVNASEKGFEREQANKDEEAGAACGHGAVTADGCVPLSES